MCARRSASRGPILANEDELLARWRATRSPRIADVLQHAPLDVAWPPRRPPSPETGPLCGAIGTLPDDPRVTMFLLRAMRDAWWPGSGMRSVWITAFAKLAELRDVRAIAQLQAAAISPPPFTGVRHTAWIVEQIELTADKLGYPLVAPDDEETLALVRASGMEPPPRGWFGDQIEPEIAALIDAVRASPDDTSTRLVLADALLARDDEWGELIALQLRETEAARARIATLIRKHGARIAGPIAHVTRAETRVYEGGFLASCVTDKALVPPRRWRRAINAPEWATVRRVTIGLGSQETPPTFFDRWLENPAVANVREIEFGTVTFVRDGRDWNARRIPRPISPTAGMLIRQFVAALPATANIAYDHDPELASLVMGPA